MFKVNFQSRNGFTLIEILVTLSIFILLFFVSANFITSSLRATAQEAEQAAAIKSARRAMDIMIREIHGATSSAHGDYPLAVVQPQNLTFYNDIDNDNKAEKISYYLSGTKLLRSVVESGDDNTYSDVAIISTLAQSVANEPIFSFFDGDNNPASTINSVRLISVQVEIKALGVRSPQPFFLKANAELRNLKDN